MREAARTPMVAQEELQISTAQVGGSVNKEPERQEETPLLPETKPRKHDMVNIWEKLK